MPALFIISYRGNKFWHFRWKQQPADNRAAALPICFSVCCSGLLILPEPCQISIIHFNTVLFAKKLPLPRSQQDSKRKCVWSWLQRNTEVHSISRKQALFTSFPLTTLPILFLIPLLCALHLCPFLCHAVSFTKGYILSNVCPQGSLQGLTILHILCQFSGLCCYCHSCVLPTACHERT